VGKPSWQISMENGRSLAGMKPAGTSPRNTSATNRMLVISSRVLRVNSRRPIVRRDLRDAAEIDGIATGNRVPWGFHRRNAPQRAYRLCGTAIHPPSRRESSLGATGGVTNSRSHTTYRA
jgi:hypothetical protein